MADLAALVSSGQFKAKKKQPERMLANFTLYVRAIKNMIVVTGKSDAPDQVKKAMLMSVGRKDMVFLFDHVGMVEEGDTFEGAVKKIKDAMTKQTNQAMIKYKLFTGMAQEGEPFSAWWTMIKEQAEKCDFTGYDEKAAARDAILFQTSNSKLRKRILAEDSDLEAVVKLGLALEHSETKSEVLGKKANTDRGVRRLQDLEAEVARLKLGDRRPPEKEKKCQTCPKGRHLPGRFAGKKADECFACGLSGHFKGAPM